MDNNKTYEVCPFCGEEVELENTLSVQQCPACGHYIVSCSMCLAKEDSDKNYCTNCCLEYLAKQMNESLVDERREKILDLIGHKSDMVIILEPLLSFQFKDNLTRIQLNYLNTIEGGVKSDTFNFEELPSKLYWKIIKSLEHHKETYDRVKKKAIEHHINASKPDFIFEDKEIPYYNREYISEMYFLDNGDVEFITHYNEHEDMSQVYVTHPLNIPLETLEAIEKFSSSTKHKYLFNNILVEYTTDTTGEGRNRGEARINAEERLRTSTPNIAKVTFSD